MTRTSEEALAMIEVGVTYQPSIDCRPGVQGVWDGVRGVYGAWQQRVGAGGVCTQLVPAPCSPHPHAPPASLMAAPCLLTTSHVP